MIAPRLVRVYKPASLPGGCVHIVIVAGGNAPHREAWQPWLVQADQLVAADGGAAHALAVGRVPDIVLGDLDSLSAHERRQLEAQGVPFEVHPRAKDETDLELALDWAVEHGARQITVLGALGGRLDHTLGNLLLLADPRWASVRLRLVSGIETVTALHDGGEVQIDGQPGDLVSLLPIGGDAVGVTTEGLAWVLSGDTLALGRTRGVSNELVAHTAHIRLEGPGGALVVVHIRRKP
jgi:thiamine pyrophosphokinase